MPTLAFAQSADEYDAESEAAPEEQKITLQEILQADNVADLLTDEELGDIGAKCKREYEVDDTSRKPWLDQIKKATDLAMQVKEEKSFPWPKASNIKYPLLTEAALQ